MTIYPPHPDGKPTFLLDIDDVVNARAPQWNSKPRKVRAMCGGREFLVRWAQPLVDRLNELDRSGLVNGLYCSTWNSYIQNLVGPMGLPSWPVAFETHALHHRAISSLKQRTAAALHNSGRRFIWADDTEVPYTWEPMRAVMEKDGRALLIRPKADIGLTPADMDAIDQFCGLYRVDPEVEAVMP